MDHRKLYQFVIEAGVKLEARTTTTATAVSILYRFINNISSEVEYCPYTAAAASIYLAGKVDEDLLKIRDVINVCHRILHPLEQPLEVDDNYWDMREGLGKLEMLILRTLQFKLTYSHPHKYLLHYLNTLQNWMPRNRWLEKIPVARTAWILLRDCYVCPDVVMKNDPKDVAVGVIFVSLRIYGEQIPNANDNDKTPWWKILHKEMRTETLKNISHKILNVYDNDNSGDNNGIKD